MTENKTDRIMEGKKYRQAMMDKLSVESGQADTCRPEEGKKRYVEKLEGRIESLTSLLDDMTKESRHLEKEMRESFDRDREELDTRIHHLKAGLSDIRQAGENAWKEMGAGVSGALKELVKGIRAAAEKF